MNSVSTSKKRRINDLEVNDHDLGSSSPSVVAGIVDILNQILLCIPVKSLLRFKSVSKQWYSLIADPLFIQNHCLQNPVSVRGFFTCGTADISTTTPKYEFVSLDKSTSSPPFETLTFIDGLLDLQIKQSCNGLLCCSNFTGSSLHYHSTYYVCNPSTKKYRPIAYGRGAELGFLDLCSVSLAFDPLKSPHYKVVCVWWAKKPINDGSYYDSNYDNYCGYQMEIYSSETESWKFCGGVFLLPYHTFSTSGVFWNGSLHWVNMSSVVYFNADLESRMTMPTPPCPEGENVMATKYFGEYRGRLYLINAYRPCTHLTIFELETDYTGWTTRCRINLNELRTAYPKIVLDISNELSQLASRILLVDANGKDSSVMVLQVQDKVVSYDLEKMISKEIYQLNTQRKNVWLRHAYLYIETLVGV